MIKLLYSTRPENQLGHRSLFSEQKKCLFHNFHSPPSPPGPSLSLHILGLAAVPSPDSLTASIPAHLPMDYGRTENGAPQPCRRMKFACCHIGMAWWISQTSSQKPEARSQQPGVCVDPATLVDVQTTRLTTEFSDCVQSSAYCTVCIRTLQSVSRETSV